MGFLAPILLLAAGAVAVPLLLHLFHRHDSRRVAFPALRYLLRTEKEHARRIRLRQLILLFLRLAVIVLVVLAGARLFVRGSGSGHDPTAVAIVLDNSMSSGAVIGEERVLDVLERLALETAAQATPDDRIWVIRVGEPWDVSPPGGPAEAIERIRSTEVSTAAGDLSAALARARELLLASPLGAREIHLLSDLQRTAFRDSEAPPAGDLPVVAYLPRSDPPPNRYLHDVLIGGGLAPVAGQRTDLSVSIGATDPEDRSEVPLRLVIDDRIRGASASQPGRGVTLPIGPFPEGRVHGSVETDPDALAADDRRHFAFRVRPPPSVALAGGEAFFLEHALGVLEQAGRIRRTAPPADVLFSVGGQGLEGRRPGQLAVVFPSTDATVLPAMNLRLAQAGLPWRVEREEGGGEARAEGGSLGVDMSGVRILRRYALDAQGEAAAGADVLVRLSNGDPWIVSGSSPAGPYLLVGSPPDPESTTLPVSAAMVPLLEWMTSFAASSASYAGRLEAGQLLAVAPGATHVRAPDGTLHAVDVERGFRETREVGVYTVLAGDSVLEQVAAGAPVRESLLGRVEETQLEERVGTRVRTPDDLESWREAVFVSRQGPELWKPLLIAALLLLLVEAWVAAPGGVGGWGRSGPPASEKDSRETLVPAP